MATQSCCSPWYLAILAVMLVTLIFLLLAQEVHALIGLTARKVIVRVFGVLLCSYRRAVGVQRHNREPYLRLKLPPYTAEIALQNLVSEYH